MNNRFYPARWKRNTINAAVGMVAVSFAPMIFAACDANISTPQITPCTLTGTEITTITNTGSLIAGSPDPIITVDSLSTGVGIENSGTVSNTGVGSAIGVDVAATGTSITNQIGGVISASHNAVDFSGNLDDTLANHGLIQAQATGVTSATAVRINDLATLSGTINNSGTIGAAVSNSAAGAHVYAVRTGGGLDASASIVNSGEITGTVTAATGHAHAYGIMLGNETSLGTAASNLGADASISNSGTISALAQSTYLGSATARAYGMYTGALGAGASISNSGSINAAATAISRVATAYGIRADDLHVGASITNSGAIVAVATPGDNGSATAYGIRVFGNLDAGASITNSGSIVARTTAGSSAFAVGISTNGLAAEASIVNAGSITASATPGDNGFATVYGIRVDGGMDADASITNSGTISATAAGGNDTPYAYGVYAADLTGIGATITNSGIIEASSSTSVDEDALAYGISVRDMYNGTGIINNGDITATSTVSMQQIHFDHIEAGTAYGISASGDLNAANITNNGAITVSTLATGSNVSARAYGVSANNLVFVSDILNDSNGAINISAISSGGDAIAYGIYASSLDASSTITNRGSIEATATQANKGYSIFVSDGEGTVNNSGQLVGNIDLGGTVNMTNTGTLSLPAGASGHVGGNYLQSGFGVLETSLTSAAPGSYGQLAVEGAADISASNKLAVSVTPVNTYHGERIENVIAATGTLTAGPTLTVTDNTLVWDFTAVLDGNTIDLIAFGTGLSSLRSVMAGTSGSGAAAVLDDFFISSAFGDQRTVGDAIGVLNSVSDISHAVRQTLPVLDGGLTRATFAALHETRNVVRLRMDYNLGQSSGDFLGADRKFWLKPFGSWADQNNRNGATGYDARTYGVMLGADGEISANTRLGVALAYSRSDMEVNLSPQSVDIDTYQVVVYGNHRLDERTDLGFQAGVALHRNDGKRAINFVIPNRVASSSYDGWSEHVGVSLSRVFALYQKLTFTPSLRMDYAHIREEGYTESGAGSLNLSVNSQSTDELILGMDGKLKYALDGSKYLIADLGVGYDVLSERNSITATFAGAPGAAFTTRGIDSSKWLARGGLGLVMNNPGSIEVSARYNFDARSDFSNQTASLKIRVPF